MGVFGLWKVLDQFGVSKAIKGQDLSGKKLAFDVSIWIHRNMHTANRNIPKIKANFLKKMLQILSCGILPVMVFDGQVLDIKRRIQKQRADLKEEYNDQILKSKRDEILKKARIKMLKKITNPAEQNEAEQQNENIEAEEDFLLESETEYDEEFEEEELSDFIYKIDFESLEFRSLPLQFQHQLLSFMREYLIFNRSTASGSNDQFFDLVDENSLSQHQLGDYSETQLQKSLLKSKIRAKMVAIESQIAMDRLNQGSFMLENDRNVTVDSYRVASEDFMHSMIIKLANHADIQNVAATGIDTSNSNKESSSDNLNEPFEKEEENLSDKAPFINGKDVPCDEMTPFGRISFKDNAPAVYTDESSDGTFVTVDDEILSTNKSETLNENHKVFDSPTNKFNLEIGKDQEIEYAEPFEQEPEQKISKFDYEDNDVAEKDVQEKIFETEDKKIDLLPSNRPQLRTEKLLEQIDVEKRNLNTHQENHLKLETKLGLEYTDIKRALKEVIQVFRIPIVESLFEAESQCAALEISGICDGTVTDDSDSFLFGSRLVIKNFFNSKSPMKSFSRERLQNSFGSNYRCKLILFASLVGSDYFGGVRGVGMKRAAEIISSLASNNAEIDNGNAFDVLLQTKILSSNSTLCEQIKQNQQEIQSKEPWNCYLHPKVKNFVKEEIVFQESFDDLENFQQYVEDLPMNKNEKLSAQLIYKSLSKPKEKPKNAKITDFIKSKI